MPPFRSSSQLGRNDGMLRRVPCFTNAELPSTKMSDFFPLTKRILVNMGNDLPVFVLAQTPIWHLSPSFPYSATVGLHGSEDCEVVVARVRNMVCQRALLFERLEVVEAMRNFISHHMSGSEELCAKLERVESDLAAAQKAVAEEAKALKLAEGEGSDPC
ncbi:hypothetical protein CK203_061697 [Vitis vinifera]|uniref:Uncharacterized protein n=1 Tax=Vitis vinifera TaxID=29760 RepID=A0A438G846_VITVI|nr:hypothetical protein CK203_061697 [Vitis vinifera]